MRYRIIIITALVFSLNILQAIGQNRSFVYPVMPDSLKSVEQRLNYLGLHYWDNFDFKDTLQLSNANISEQGFVNFIDLIPHFTPTTAEQSVHIFASKAFGSQKSKDKFESLIEHYLGNPKSPMRNDKVYLLFIKDIIASPCIDDVEKERWTFKYKQTNKTCPAIRLLTSNGRMKKEFSISMILTARIVIRLQHGSTNRPYRRISNS